MLKKIRILIRNHQYDVSEWNQLKSECKKRGIELDLIQTGQLQKDQPQREQIQKEQPQRERLQKERLQKEQQQKNQSQEKYSESAIQMSEDSILITDARPDCEVKLPVVGLGLDYSGECTYLVEEPASIDLAYLEMVYSRFYNIPLIIAETEHLMIREMTLEDLDQMYELYQTLSDCEYVEQLYEWNKEEEFTRNYISHMYGFFGYGLWLVFQKQDQKLIGRAGIENREIDGETVQELGYLIGRPWQHQHYALETCEAILTYAKCSLGLERLYLCTHEKNIPSTSLAAKLAFEAYAMNIDGMNIYRKEL